MTPDELATIKWQLEILRMLNPNQKSLLSVLDKADMLLREVKRLREQVDKMAGLLAVDDAEVRQAMVEIFSLNHAVMVAAVEDMQIELSQWREASQKVIDDKCPSDEKHCSCVPFLRMEINRLRDELAK